MTNVTIIGTGKMGGAIAGIVAAGGGTVQALNRDGSGVEAASTSGKVGDPITGDLVVLALPYPAVGEVLEQYSGQLDGKVLVDLTNPLDFATFDALVVPVGSSAAAEIAAKVPSAKVLKAFNTNFAATLASREVAGQQVSVLIAGDDRDAKNSLAAILEAGGVKAVDAGSLKRAHELEALGFLQLTLAAADKTSWTSGFVLAD
jgi:hypothetical protein